MPYDRGDVGDLGNARIAWVGILLVVGTYLLDEGLLLYRVHLSRAGRLAQLVSAKTHGIDVYALGVLFLIVIAVFLVAPRPLRSVREGDISRGWAIRLKRAGEVLLAATLALLAAWPLLLRDDKAYRLLTLVAAYPSIPENVAALILFFVVMPFALELVFRSVLFRACELWAGVLATSIAVSLLYAYIWPFPAFVPSFFLGVASSAIYCRSRSVLSAAATNIMFMVGTSLLLIWINLK